MKQQTKSGGNVQKNVSDLLVPFGLMLAKESLESFLKKQQKTPAKSPKKVSLSGGGSCSKSAGSLEGFSKQSSYAKVGGKPNANAKTNAKEMGTQIHHKKANAPQKAQSVQKAQSAFRNRQKQK